MHCLLFSFHSPHLIINSPIRILNLIISYYCYYYYFQNLPYSNEANISIIPTDSIIGMGAKGEKKELFFFFIRFPRIVALEIS